MSNTYRFDMNITICPNCHQAVEVPPQTQQVTCPSCRQSFQTPARKTGRLQLGDPNLPDTDRRAMLVAQDHKPLLPPPQIQGLFADGTVPEWKLDEALATWNGMRTKLASGPDPIAAEALYVLTLVLGSNQKLDDRVQRGLAESAVAVLSLPRHEQVLLSHLAMGAARRGDARSARLWLQRCDIHANDIQADSAWRVASAFAATAADRFEDVLALLEPDGVPWPIDDSMDPMAVCLRANAHEHLGRIDQGAAILASYFKEGGVSGQNAIQQIASRPGAVTLCEISLGKAEDAAKQEAAVAAGRMNRFIALILFGVAAFDALLTSVIIYAGWPTKNMSQFARTIRMRNMMINAGIWGVVFVALVVAGLVILIRGRTKQRIVQQGTKCRANILSLERTGTYVNNIPQYRLELEVTLPGQASYRASTKQLLDPAAAATMLGASIAVWVDPKYPKKVIIA